MSKATKYLFGGTGNAPWKPTACPSITVNEISNNILFTHPQRAFEEYRITRPLSENLFSFKYLGSFKKGLMMGLMKKGLMKEGLMKEGLIRGLIKGLVEEGGRGGYIISEGCVDFELTSY